MFPDSNESVVAELSQWVCHEGANPCGTVLGALANMGGSVFQVADVSGPKHFLNRVRYANRVRKSQAAPVRKTVTCPQTRDGYDFAVKSAGRRAGRIHVRHGVANMSQH
ncbi:hypothetical protein LMG29542_01159 [Paraburkholderia humisilvae]|uniref:Uncharacterized protein n=1 Tax=Paraburkholderia humisilvae TaxID=627669 RepID=A0A6J5D9B6_9BURK|nr:hypothetical protein LMG29542_01159 [Paraburkholderia humisilvae]